jgi:hypothetical protein
MEAIRLETMIENDGMILVPGVTAWSKSKRPPLFTG